MKRVLGLSLTIFLTTVGWAQNGGFQQYNWYQLQETAPGMIIIEGGLYSFDDGNTRDTMYNFYISAMEETNGQYLAYLAFLQKCYSVSTYNIALPDTTVWLKENFSDSLKQFLTKNYLRDPAFRDYPVVGVSPAQIQRYAAWKSDQLNEMILIREGILDFWEGPCDSTQIFSTEIYLSGKWTGPIANPIPSLDPNGGERLVRMEDGIFLPNFRMLTEKEWTLAQNYYGDKDQKYVVTPKEIGNRKFDKKNHFGHLYVKRKVNKHPSTKWLSTLLSLQAVYDDVPNNYLIHGLNGNVSEWVVGADGKYVVKGRSWTFLATGEKGVSATTGFRLGMSYIGPLDPNLKRRKAK